MPLQRSTWSGSPFSAAPASSAITNRMGRCSLLPSTVRSNEHTCCIALPARAVSKSLREIQEEEWQQQQLLRQRQQQQATAAQQHSTPQPHSPFSGAAATPSSVAANAGSPWVKAGSRAATAEPLSPQPMTSQPSPPLPGFPALNEVASQAASTAMRGSASSGAAAVQQQQQAEGTGPGPRGTTLG
eukprot:1161684-Pelagomonas_calceolata.AAC.7